MRAAAMRWGAWGAALVVPAAVFSLYLAPDMAMTLANQLWNCF